MTMAILAVVLLALVPAASYAAAALDAVLSDAQQEDAAYLLDNRTGQAVIVLEGYGGYDAQKNYEAVLSAPDGETELSPWFECTIDVQAGDAGHTVTATVTYTPLDSGPPPEGCYLVTLCEDDEPIAEAVFYLYQAATLEIPVLDQNGCMPLGSAYIELAWGHDAPLAQNSYIALVSAEEEYRAPLSEGAFPELVNLFDFLSTQDGGEFALQAGESYRLVLPEGATVYDSGIESREQQVAVLTLGAAPQASISKDSIVEGEDIVLTIADPQNTSITKAVLSFVMDGRGPAVESTVSLPMEGPVVLQNFLKGSYAISFNYYDELGEYALFEQEDQPVLTFTVQEAPASPQAQLALPAEALVGGAASVEVQFGADPCIASVQLAIKDSQGEPADGLFTLDPALPRQDQGATMGLSPLSAAGGPFSVYALFVDGQGETLYQILAGVLVVGDTAPSVDQESLTIGVNQSASFQISFGTNTAGGIRYATVHSESANIRLDLNQRYLNGATVSVTGVEPTADAEVLVRFFNEEEQWIPGLDIVVTVCVQEDPVYQAPSVSPAGSLETPVRIVCGESAAMTVEFGGDPRIERFELLSGDGRLVLPSLSEDQQRNEGQPVSFTVKAGDVTGPAALTVRFLDEEDALVTQLLVHFEILPVAPSAAVQALSVKVGGAQAYVVDLGTDPRVAGVQLFPMIKDAAGNWTVEDYTIVAVSPWWQAAGERFVTFQVTGKAQGQARIAAVFYDAQDNEITEYELYLAVTVQAEGSGTPAGDFFGGAGGSSGSGQTSSSGGTAPAPTPAEVSQPKELTQQDAAAAARQAAEEAQKAGSRTPVIRLRGIGLATKDALDALAREAGSDARVYADSIVGRAVNVRISFLAGRSTLEAVDLSASTVSDEAVAIQRRFERTFGNRLAVVACGQKGAYGMTVTIAAKVDLTDMDAKNLYIYRYDAETNTYRRLKNVKYRIDSNGYVHFDIKEGGAYIISDGPLKKRT